MYRQIAFKLASIKEFLKNKNIDNNLKVVLKKNITNYLSGALLESLSKREFILFFRLLPLFRYVDDHIYFCKKIWWGVRKHV